MTYNNLILSLLSLSFTLAPVSSFAGEGQEPPRVDLSCGISVTPQHLECGQGTATLQLDATTTTCSDEYGTPSAELCPDLLLTWRTDAPGPNGETLPVLEYQGEPQPTLTIATQVDGVSIGSAYIRLIAIAFSHDLKVVCEVPITVGECHYDCNDELGGSAEYDDCGVCGGDNSSCTDCAGEVHGTAEYDECGVCGGNGSSCIECETLDITSEQFELDGVAQNIKDLTYQTVKTLRRVSGRKNGFKKYNTIANEAASVAWSSIWTLEQVQQSNCSNTILCTQSDNLPVIESYTGALDTLKENLDRLVKKLRRKYNRKQKARKIRKEANGQYELGILGAQSLPLSQESCDLGTS